MADSESSRDDPQMGIEQFLSTMGAELRMVRFDEIERTDPLEPNPVQDAFRRAMGELTRKQQAEATVTLNAQRLRAVWYDIVRSWQGKPVLVEIARVLIEIRDAIADSLWDGGIPQIELTPVKGRTWENGEPKDLVRIRPSSQPWEKGFSDAMNRSVISETYLWDQKRRDESGDDVPHVSPGFDDMDGKSGAAAIE